MFWHTKCQAVAPRELLCPTCWSLKWAIAAANYEFCFCLQRDDGNRALRVSLVQDPLSQFFIQALRVAKNCKFGACLLHWPFAWWLRQLQKHWPQYGDFGVDSELDDPGGSLANSNSDHCLLLGSLVRCTHSGEGGGSSQPVISMSDDISKRNTLLNLHQVQLPLSGTVPEVYIAITQYPGVPPLPKFEVLPNFWVS